jgi:cephalosporin hydroxylase
MTYDDVARGYGLDKSSLDHDYMPTYERLLEAHPDRTVWSVLEVGVAGGGSLLLWKDLFPGAAVTGVDILPVFPSAERYGIVVVLADATDRQAMGRVVERGPFDLIVDDGSHVPADVWATLLLLHESVSVGGVYVIEDLNYPYEAEEIVARAAHDPRLNRFAARVEAARSTPADKPGSSLVILDAAA